VEGENAYIIWLSFLLLFHPDPSLKDGAASIKIGLLPLVNPLWKFTHRHTQRYALLIS
jgi:hypothetical protein